MPVYETISAEIQRPHLTARDLRLGFELRDEFCSAAWQALDIPVQVALTCQRQKTPNTIHERAILEITEELKDKLGSIATNAIFAEAKRINDKFPDALTHGDNVERLVAGCVERDHLVLPVFYKAYRPGGVG